MRILLIIARILTGLLFTFSGFVKAVDPLGSTYKFTDYFNAFGLTWMAPLAFFLAMLLNTMEFLVGVSLLLNVKSKLASLGALLFMAFFTPLTLVLAITNPVHDCGCFGDFLVLTNWETFGKNIVILLVVLFLFIFRKKMDSKISEKIQWFAAGGITLMIILFQFFCMRYYIPAFDFRPYSMGTNIPEKMLIPENAPKDEYKTLLYYKKDGVTKEFTEENYPWQDSTWIWVDTKSVLVKEGYKAPIHDFTITPVKFDDKDSTVVSNIADIILADEGISLIAICYDLSITNKNSFQKLNRVVNLSNEKGYKFYTLTSTPPKDIQAFIKETSFAGSFFQTDAITLKTIIRSNPGLLMLKKGIIVGKWHYSQIPENEELIKIISTLK